MVGGSLFLVGQVLGRAASFVLGWATSLFFGQIPGGKERVVSILSMLALAWLLITYVGGTISVVVLGLHGAGVLHLHDVALDDARILSILIGIVVLPPLLTLIAEMSHLVAGFSIGRWFKSIPASYPAAISLGLGVALMLVVGPIVLIRRRRRGLRTHHIPVLVAKGQFHELVAEIVETLREATDRDPIVGSLAGLWSLPMRAMRFAAERLFESVVRSDPVLVVAGHVEVAAYAMDVNVTAPADEAYELRATLYKRFGVGRMHLTWSARSQKFEERLWKLRDEHGLTRDERLRRLERIEHEIDRAPIGSDEWNVLYRIVLQVRDEPVARRRRELSAS